MLISYRRHSNKSAFKIYRINSSKTKQAAYKQRIHHHIQQLLGRANLSELCLAISNTNCWDVYHAGRLSIIVEES